MDAATVVGSMGLALDSLRTLREFAKDHKDTALKEQISAAYDRILEVQAAFSEVIQENTSLKERLRARTIRRDQNFGYVYLEGETDPICQRCFYESKGATVSYLDPLQKYDSGCEERRCPVCNKRYTEKPGRQTDIQPSHSNWVGGYIR